MELIDDEPDKAFRLKKDIVIPAGTIFDNYSDGAKFSDIFECVHGLGKDYCEQFAITDMEDLNKNHPEWFEEVKK